MDWLLMNRDTPLFYFCSSIDLYGDTLVQEKAWLSPLRPLGYPGLWKFLTRRRASTHRKNMGRILADCGCRTLEGFLRITHAASLNDTFWVKEADSPLCWAEVSLYANAFDPGIAAAALTGSPTPAVLSAPSSEFTTGGRCPKCWQRDRDGIHLYKAGSSAGGREALSEALSAQLAALLCRGFVDYRLDVCQGRPVSRCRLFTSEEVGFFPVAHAGPEMPTVSRLLEWFSRAGCEDDFRRLCILDALLLNTDRHPGNMGLLVRNATQEVLGMAPVFDFNRALLSDLDDPLPAVPGDSVQQRLPWFGRDFIATGRGLMTDAIRSDLKNLEGFRFTLPASPFPVDNRRLERLSAVVNHQIQQLLA